MKRARSGSISKRLKSANELCEEGMIDKEAKGALKDLIIRDDPKLQEAMKRLEEGDKAVLQDLLRDGALGRRESIDLMGEYGDLNLDFLHVAADPNESSLQEKEFLNGSEQFQFSYPDENHLSSVIAESLGSNHSSSAHNFRNLGVRGETRSSGIREHVVDFGQASKPIGIRTRDNKSRIRGEASNPDLFDFPYFEDSAIGSPMLMAMTPPTIDPQLQSVGSSLPDQFRPLHRDSIALMDDEYLDTEQGQYSDTFEIEIPAVRTSNRQTKPRRNAHQNPPTAKPKSRAKPKNQQSKPKPISKTQQDDRAALIIDTESTSTGQVGGYSPESRRQRIEKFLQKRQNRVWMKRVKYDVRKNFADSRLRVKGRFVKKEDEELLREFIIMTL